MRKGITLLLISLLFASSHFANTNNVYKIHGTQMWMQTVVTDKLTNAHIEITPKGLYAQVEMTFVMEGNNLSGLIAPFWNLQGVLSFELPPNSYIYDSWLWYDDSTILKAYIIDRSKAQEVYYGIVFRNCDPSLLEKTGDNTYQLHVFPLRPDFPRKVKITYCTQMTYRDNEAFVTLPTDLFCASDVKPSLNVTVNKTAEYGAPTLLEADYNNMLTQTDAQADELTITPDKYSITRELNLRYTTTHTSQLNYHPLNSNKGIYEVLLPAENTEGPKHFVFALETVNNAHSHGSIGEMKKAIRTFLLTDCRPIDSFNIYYIDGGIHQSFTGWGPADNATVLAALDAIPESVTNADSLLVPMLIASYQHCQQKPQQEVQYVLMSSTSNFSTTVTSNSVVQQLTAGVGSLSHRFNAISFYSKPYITTLTQNTGGRKSELKGVHFNEWGLHNTYDISPKSDLKRLLYDLYESAAYTELTLPVTFSLVTQREILNPKRQYHPGLPYMESGVYYGQLTGNDVTLEYAGTNSVVSRSETIPNTAAGDSLLTKGWIYSYITKLDELNPQMHQAQIRDSSINNRVLCKLTAFLALEPQDTMLLTGNPNWWSWPLQLSASNITAENSIAAYPNPFRQAITFESAEIIEEVVICDITGKTIFASRTATKRFVFDGGGEDNSELSPGLYLVRVKSGGKEHYFKINKL
ncbi:MAG: T9SS type A sorting domain-containing protein [Flavipsychrobacter sp.]|nr:T9SS type A sorting domain-containing protein [Flavipsychrobacter sp.]